MTEHANTEARLSDRDRVLLVGLADGTLRGRRRAHAEALLRELPDGAVLLERQRRVRRALREGPAPVPAATVGLPPRTRPVLRWAPAAALAGAVAALLLALVIVPGGDRSVVAQAAALAERPATEPAPGSAGPVLRAAVDGVAFPDWSREFGWEEVGSRRDVLDGRATTTVFYEHMGHRLAYTILPGPPSRPSKDAEIVRRNGLEIAVSHDAGHGGHDIAVFERDGRTCVLAGHVERVSTLLDLAAWTGGRA